MAQVAPPADCSSVAGAGQQAMLLPYCSAAVAAMKRTLPSAPLFADVLGQLAPPATCYAESEAGQQGVLVSQCAAQAVEAASLGLCFAESVAVQQAVLVPECFAQAGEQAASVGRCSADGDHLCRLLSHGSPSLLVVQGCLHTMQSLLLLEALCYCH